MISLGVQPMGFTAPCAWKIFHSNVPCAWQEFSISYIPLKSVQLWYLVNPQNNFSRGSSNGPDTNFYSSKYSAYNILNI